MKRPWTLGVILLVVIVALAVGFVWMFPESTPDPQKGGSFTARYSDFESAVILIARRHGGIVQPLDNKSDDYLVRVSVLQPAVSATQFERLRALAGAKDRFSTSPNMVGKQLDKIRDDEILILVDSPSKPSVRAVRKDGYLAPASDG